MEAIRIQKIVAEDGEVVLTDLPYKKGQSIEIIMLSQSANSNSRSRLTVRQLRQSGLIGLWKDRNEMRDSSAYARRLREQTQKRGDINYDFIG